MTAIEEVSSLEEFTPRSAPSPTPASRNLPGRNLTFSVLRGSHSKACRPAADPKDSQSRLNSSPSTHHRAHAVAGEVVIMPLFRSARPAGPRSAWIRSSALSARRHRNQRVTKRSTVASAANRCAGTVLVCVRVTCRSARESSKPSARSRPKLTFRRCVNIGLRRVPK